MSMENAGDDRETQASYVFPPEYAMASPDSFLSRTQPDLQPLPIAPPERERRVDRLRSVLIFGGAVLVVCALGFGVWLALASAGPSADAASPGVAATATSATGADATAGAGRTLTFRVTITSLGTDSFTGTVLANGDPVTIALTADTRFGTKARPLSRADLSVGGTVLVRGRRTGADTVTATIVT